jgi:hypothetical protein
MTRVEARPASALHLGLLASAAFGFVRDQIDTVTALGRAMRRAPIERRNEESW